jgi:hypothetical protein
MADFLSRLAQRALGDGQAVRPMLLPGAFPEPAEPTVVNGQRSAEMPTPRMPDAPVRQDERIRRKPMSVAPSAVARQPLVHPPSSSHESGHDAVPLHKAAAAPPGSTRQPGIDRHPAPHVAPFGRVSPDGQGYRSSSIVQSPSFGTKGDASRDDVAPPPLGLVSPRPVEYPTPAPDEASEAFITHRSSLIAQPLLLVPEPHATAARRGQPPTGAIMPDIESRPSAGQSPIVNRQSPISCDAEARPMVKVTIGRVEVRAVTPPAPVPPRAAPPRARKTLSLDDYLGQRNRGER